MDDDVMGRVCVGCGHCCMTGPCHLFLERHPIDALSDGWKGCPELVFKHGRHWCGIVIGCVDVKEMFLMMVELGVGFGCCSTFNTWRREPIVDRRGARDEQAASQG